MLQFFIKFIVLTKPFCLLHVSMASSSSMFIATLLAHWTMGDTPENVLHFTIQSLMH